MSGDEILVLIAALFVSAFTWGRWLVVWARHRHPGDNGAALLPPLLAAPMSGALLFALLTNFASHDVRDSGVYLLFYGVMGLALTGMTAWLLDQLGLSLRDDVLERRNVAAGVAWAGVMIGMTLAFAGANIGDGPGWWVVVFSSGLSLGSLVLGWVLLDRIGQSGEAIAVERDLACGVRMAAWFIAAGLLTGRAAAGDWVSASATTADFAKIAGAALVLTLVAAVAEASLNRGSRPRGAGDWLGAGLAVGATWVGLSLVQLWRVGRW